MSLRHRTSVRCDGNALFVHRGQQPNATCGSVCAADAINADYARQKARGLGWSQVRLKDRSFPAGSVDLCPTCTAHYRLTQRLAKARTKGQSR